MIDEEWLKGLDFVSDTGMHIRGLAGVGANNVVFNADAPDGKKLVMKTRRHHLGFHIKEIPLLLSGTPRYDLDRVNRKLLKLIGNDDLDEMTAEYDRLFSALLKMFHGADRGLGAEQMALLLPLICLKMTPSCPEALQFLLATRMTARRLEEIATLAPGDPGDWKTMFIEVNGENFKISGTHQELTTWAKGMIEVRERLQPGAPLEPETLPENPLYVWGAAVMDGFFTDAELPEVVRFIEAKFGRLPSHPRVGVFLDQIVAIATALTCLNYSEVARLVKLCGMLGFMFDIHDKDWKVVASSMRPDLI
jgi:hypothetical protein